MSDTSVLKKQKLNDKGSSPNDSLKIDLSSFRANTNTFLSTTKHPLGILPDGNYLMSIRGSNEKKIKHAEDVQKNLGHLSMWSYEQIIEFVKNYVDDPQTLKSLQHSSRLMYGLLFEDDIWKNCYTKEYGKLEEEQKSKEIKNTIVPFKELGASDTWRGTWRKTLLNVPEEEEEAMIKSQELIFSDFIFRPYQNRHINYKKTFKKILELEKTNFENCNNGNLLFSIDRFVEDEFYKENNFATKFHNKPFILQNTLACKPKRINKIEDLLETFTPESKFRQEVVEWSLKEYFKYYHANKDESPLYLFDCNKDLLSKLKEYFVKPNYSELDFFNLFEETRPDHLWIIAGPGNTGSTFHKDPNSTSAWNQLLSGLKLWIMLPPDVSPPGVIADSEEENVTAPLSLSEWVNAGFFNDCLKLCEKNTSEKQYCLIGCTYPGETIYVPSNWWHSVINIEASVAMTGNFVPKENLHRVLNFFKNRKLQISGFHLKNLIVSMADFHSKNLNAYKATTENMDAIIGRFVNFFESGKSVSLLKDIDDEDCGVLEDEFNSILNEIPIYEYFVLLIDSDPKLGLHLQDSMKKLQELEKQQNSGQQAKVRESEMWAKLIQHIEVAQKGANSGFAFNFADESSDGD
ncbi:hypothetical protein ACO0OE_002340 [Hanseniaspora uvarum]